MNAESLNAWRATVRARARHRMETGEWEDYIATFDASHPILDELHAEGVIDDNGVLTDAGRRAAAFMEI